MFEDEKDEECEIYSVLVFAVDKEDRHQSFIDYLKEGKLNDLRRTDVWRQAARFMYYKDTLFWRSFEGVFLRCLGEEEIVQVMEETHSGICGAH